MSLPALSTLPTTQEELDAWAFNHQANHFDIVAAGQRLQQITFTIATNIGTLAGNSVMQFNAVPATIQDGMTISDTTTPSAITNGTQVTAFNGTEVQMGIPAAGNIGSGDDILFGPGANVKSLTQYQLSPMNSNDRGMWLFRHQTMHNEINALLGTSGLNLLEVDFEDPDQFQEWLNQNAGEHQRICTALGIP
jgi:hypothetical protein